MNKKSKREAKMIAKANRFINRKPPESREADDTPSTDTLNEMSATEIYAERDAGLAVEVAAMIG